jgi:SAM-dependent methyltransferase
MLFVPEKRYCPEFLDRAAEEYRLDELEGSLADIRLVNRYLGDRYALLKHLDRLTESVSAFTLLDVATGSADIPVAIARWARRRRMRVSITAVDINPRTVEIARRHTVPYPEIGVELADGLRLPYPDRSFDFVICSKTAHHLGDRDSVTLLREMLRVANRGFLLMDLRRSWVAYGLIRILTTIFTRNRLTRNDAPLSVLRSFTGAELAALASEAGAGRFVVSHEPFWLLMLSGEVA